MQMRVAKRTWFSEDPDRRWVEVFFLKCIPVWIALMATAMVTGIYRSLSDPMWIVLGLLIALPQVVGPYVWAPSREARAYAAKFNLWVWLFAFAGNYFFTRYVEDLYGLVYRFNITWNFAAVGLGRTRGKIPFVMTLFTQAYFMTYFTIMFMVYRRTGKRWVMWIPLSFAMAFAETASMATPVISDVFWYEDKLRMLTWGSAGYGTGFLISAPLLFRMQSAWPWSRVILESMAAAMLQFYAYELWSWLLV